MRKNVFYLKFLSLFILFLSVESFAETIYLKDGQVVKGQIIDKGSYYVTVKVGNAPYKYFNDQIDRIEGDKSFNNSFSTKVEPSKFPEILPQKIELIDRLMKANGTKQMMTQNMQQIIENAPIERKSSLEELLKVDTIIEKLIPIYDRYYSEEDLKAMVAFYESTTGQKMQEATPQVMTEAVKVMVEYFQQHSQSLQ